MARGRSMERSPDSPSSVACGATFPTQGKAATVFPWNTETASIFCTIKEVEQKRFALPKEAFPLGGEGGTPVPDEGESGERNHITYLFAAPHFLHRKE